VVLAIRTIKTKTKFQVRMQDAQQILDYSTIAITLVAAIVAFSTTFSGIKATLGGREFGYRFNKSRLPKCAYMIAGLAALTFLYSLIIAQQVPAVLVYAAIMTFFGGLGILISVGYTPR
jgi:hypothetical protein